MIGYSQQQFTGNVIEDVDVPFSCRIAGIFLSEHLNHHVVSALIDERYHYLLTVHLIIAFFVFLSCCIRNLPDKVPCQFIRKLEAKLFNISLIYVACLRGAHVRYGIIMTVYDSLIKELGDHLILSRRIKAHLTAAQAVFSICQKFIQRYDGINAGQICGNVVRVCNADIRCGIGGDVGNDIVVDTSVIGIQTDIDFNVGIEFLESLNGINIDL